MSSAYVATGVGDNRIKRGATIVSMIFAIILMGSLPASAHEIRPSIVDMTVEDGRAVLAVETNLEAWLADIGDEHENTDDAPAARLYDRLRALDPAGLQAEFADRQSGFAQAVQLIIAGEPVPLEVVDVDVPAAPDLDFARDTSVRLASFGQVDTQANTTIAFTERFSETIIRVNGPDGTTFYSEFLRGDMATAPFTLAETQPQGWWEVFVSYISTGFAHILIIDGGGVEFVGLDHILLVIGLFLLSPRLKPLVLQITAFTLAHTITLALGATGVVALTPWIVESIIALSIVYVAVENIVLKSFSSRRVALVFAFGLLHGLGFSSVLGDFGLPAGQFVPALVGFNIGVELGQLFVIAVCLALTFLIRNKGWYRQVVTIPVSIVIALIGLYWVLERTGILPESLGGLV